MHIHKDIRRRLWYLDPTLQKIDDTVVRNGLPSTKVEESPVFREIQNYRLNGRFLLTRFHDATDTQQK